MNTSRTSLVRSPLQRSCDNIELLRDPRVPLRRTLAMLRKVRELELWISLLGPFKIAPRNEAQRQRQRLGTRARGGGGVELFELGNVRIAV